MRRIFLFQNFKADKQMSIDFVGFALLEALDITSLQPHTLDDLDEFTGLKLNFCCETLAQKLLFNRKSSAESRKIREKNLKHILCSTISQMNFNRNFSRMN